MDTKNDDYGAALGDVFDQTFRQKVKSLGKGAVKSGIAWIQPYFGEGKLAFANPFDRDRPLVARFRANETGRLHSLL